jgi:hypothetical protein
MAPAATQATFRGPMQLAYEIRVLHAPPSAGFDTSRGWPRTQTAIRMNQPHIWGAARRREAAPSARGGPLSVARRFDADVSVREGTLHERLLAQGQHQSRASVAVSNRNRVMSSGKTDHAKALVGRSSQRPPSVQLSALAA